MKADSNITLLSKFLLYIYYIRVFKRGTIQVNRCTLQKIIALANDIILGIQFATHIGQPKVLVSDKGHTGKSDPYSVHFLDKQKKLFQNMEISHVSGILYLLSSTHIVEDIERLLTRVPFGDISPCTPYFQILTLVFILQ